MLGAYILANAPKCCYKSSERNPRKLYNCNLTYERPKIKVWRRWYSFSTGWFSDSSRQFPGEKPRLQKVKFLVIPNQIFPETTIWRPEAIARSGRRFSPFGPPHPPLLTYFISCVLVSIFLSRFHNLNQTHRSQAFCFAVPWAGGTFLRWRKGGFPVGIFCWP